MSGAAAPIVKFSEARWELRAADLGVVRTQDYSPTSALIGLKGRSLVSHALFVDLWDGLPMALESREWIGSRGVTLESQVRRYPGAILILRPRLSDEQAETAAVVARRMLGQPYDYRAILAMWLLHLPLAQACYRMREVTLDGGETIEGAKHCSRFYGAALELGALVDPVPHLAGKFTEPGDFLRTDFFRPLFWLIP